jgi:lipopolysaccharide biosynthesis protein
MPQIDTQLIAFYLPQFHPIPENDAWWGKGFTEWRSVVRARALFAGHHQPQLPADLGFYDLRVPETRAEQAALARRYGIHGFCYYYYWFNGRRCSSVRSTTCIAAGNRTSVLRVLGERELDAALGRTRRRHPVAQRFRRRRSASCRGARAMFRDARYIRVHERPLFVVYRARSLPDRAASPSGSASRRDARGSPTRSSPTYSCRTFRRPATGASMRRSSFRRTASKSARSRLPSNSFRPISR